MPMARSRRASARRGFRVRMRSHRRALKSIGAVKIRRIGRSEWMWRLAGGGGGGPSYKKKTPQKDLPKNPRNTPFLMPNFLYLKKNYYWEDDTPPFLCQTGRVELCAERLSTSGSVRSIRPRPIKNASCARSRVGWAARSSGSTRIMASAAPGDATSGRRSTSCAVMPRVGNSTWSWLGRWGYEISTRKHCWRGRQTKGLPQQTREVRLRGPDRNLEDAV